MPAEHAAAEGVDSREHIVLVTDAWYPQVNGVVRSWDMVRGELERLGYRVTVIAPEQFRTIPCPTYPSIRLAVNTWPKLGRMLRAAAPDYVHIATEGPLGWAARRVCLKEGWRFTTSFHTKFPEYIQRRFRVPERWSYAVLRRFHRKAAHMLVATPSLKRELEEKGFNNTALWTRGVDTALFTLEYGKALLDGYARPIWLYVGRVAVEKNLEAFLALPLEGTKLVVGDGPALKPLQEKYTDSVFLGAKFGEELAQHFAASDVFVFPSKTDTFGLVMLEAMASGLPVAAYPVTGPVDVVKSKKVGVLDEDLATAAMRALALRPEDARAYALQYSWENCAKLFLQYATLARQII